VKSDNRRPSYDNLNNSRWPPSTILDYGGKHIWPFACCGTPLSAYTPNLANMSWSAAEICPQNELRQPPCGGILLLVLTLTLWRNGSNCFRMHTFYSDQHGPVVPHVDSCTAVVCVIGISIRQMELQQLMATTLTQSWRKQFSSRGSWTASCSASFRMKRTLRENEYSSISGVFCTVIHLNTVNNRKNELIGYPYYLKYRRDHSTLYGIVKELTSQRMQSLQTKMKDGRHSGCHWKRRFLRQY